MRQHLMALLLGLSATASAAPLGISPGQTDLTRARSLLGEPKSTLIESARYQFAAPAGSGYSSIELYVGRQSQAVEIAQYRFEPAVDVAPLKTQLKQKDPDLRYNIASGDACELYFGARARLILTKEGKVKAIEYLSAAAMQVLLTEVAPFKADRSSVSGAYQAFLAALFTKRDADLTASLGGAKSAAGLEVAYLTKMHSTLLLALEEASVTLPVVKAGAKEAIVKVNHPRFGATEYVFLASDKGWVLSRIAGLELALEKIASTPRAALSLYLRSLGTKLPVKTPPDVTAMSAWGDEWYLIAEKMPITAITVDGAKAIITLSADGKSAQASLVLEAKLWRVTEIKP
jgi:hypothetical protein